jgi:hypothetical protein
MILSRRDEGRLEQSETASQSFDHTYDLIVVGLGTAGAIALLAAARRGLRVLGIERTNGMGGVGTNGAVLCYYFGSKGGLYESVDAESNELEAEGYTPSVGVNAELKKLMLERLALEAGAELRYEATLTGVYLEGNAVRGVRWLEAGRHREAGAAIVLDCTGDAEVCALAGCKTRLGRDWDHQPQPFSNVLVVWDGKRVTFLYTDSGYVDPTDADDVSRAIINSALQATHLKDTYQEGPRFIKLAPLLGIREGRFIKGERDLTFASYVNDEFTEEPLFYAYSNLDNHSKDIAFESELQRDWSVVGSLWGLNFSVPVPLGALIPQGYDGLIAAGRCIALDHDLAGCVRMKRDMQKCGEAAAIVAAVAIENGVPPRKAPYSQIKPLLQETGCLHMENHVGMKDTQTHEDDLNPRVQWLTDAQQIREGLTGVKPGLAIWSARREGARLLPVLREWASQTAEPNLRRHAAFALGLLRDEAGLPVLRETLRERDPFVPRTSRKYNQVRGYAAAYLLGKLADEASVPELLQILQEAETYRNTTLDAEFIADDREYGFQYYSFAMMALGAIGQRHPARRGEIAEALLREAEREDTAWMISFKGGRITHIKHDMTAKLKEAARRIASNWGQDREAKAVVTSKG